MKKTIISLLLFCFATFIMAQSKLSPYTRHFINEKEQIKMDKTFSSKFKVKKIDEIDYVKAYIYLKAQTDPIFRKLWSKSQYLHRFFNHSANSCQQN